MCQKCVISNRRLVECSDSGSGFSITDLAMRVQLAEAAGQSLIEYMRGRQRWVSLHGHSEFSLLDGGAKVKAIIDKAKAMGQDAVAITDHGNLHGAVKAHQYAQKVGIKHIVGCEFYLTPFGRRADDKDFKKGERVYHHLVVLAKNATGYKNLCKLSSLGYTDGFYRNPRIDREMLAAHSEGLIVTSSCVGGTIPMNAYEGNFYEAQTETEWFLKHFGDDFYFEVQDHGIEIEDVCFEYIRTQAQKYNVPKIVTTDAHYLDQTDNINHDILLCIGTGQFVDGERKFKFDGSGYHYAHEGEILKAFPHELEAIYNTGVIADKIDEQVIEFGDTKLPYFNIPTGDVEFDTWRATQGELSWLSLKN